MPVTANYYLAYQDGNNGNEIITHRYDWSTRVFTPEPCGDNPVQIRMEADVVEFRINGDLAMRIQDGVLCTQAINFSERPLFWPYPKVHFYRKTSPAPARLATLTIEGMLSCYAFRELDLSKKMTYRNFFRWRNPQPYRSALEYFDTVGAFVFTNAGQVCATIGSQGVITTGIKECVLE